MTLKVDKRITLWRPKGGQTNNSPVYIYIASQHIAVELLSAPSLALLEVIIWSKFAFSKTPIAKNTIKIGVSAQFFGKHCAQNI